MTTIIQTIGISKSFRKNDGWRGVLTTSFETIDAVRDAYLDVFEGELFGLLGPNGAGKTTLVKLLATLVEPTSGTAKVAGYDLSQPIALKSQIGLATGDERSFFWRLSGAQNLEFFARLHNIPKAEINTRIAKILSRLELTKVADNRFQTYSTGMRQRLAIARSLLHNPRVLFLDEPTQGLDPIATQRLQKWIREDLVNKEGMTVFLTTHNLSEAERLCDRIAIMESGRIRACGTVSELQSQTLLQPKTHIRINAPLVQVQTILQDTLSSPSWQQKKDSVELIQEEQSTEIHLSGEPGPVNELIDLLREHDLNILDLQTSSTSLEELFNILVDHKNDHQIQPNESYVTQTYTPLPPDNSLVTGGFHLDGILSVFRAFLKRDFLNEASYRIAFVLQFTSIFLSIGVFYFIARLLGAAAAPLLEPYGGDYFTFVMIGIAFGGYFGVGLSSFASRLRLAQTTGTLEAMLATPTGLSTIIVGSSLWDYLVTTLRVLVYLVLGGLIAGINLSGPNYLGAVLVLLLSVPAFGSIGIISASIIMVIKRGDPITWMMNALSGLLGGIYYPIEILPGWLKSISQLLPITYALEAMRRTLLQGASIYEIRWELTILILFSAVLFPTSLLIFKQAVQRAREDGSLTHY